MSIGEAARPRVFCCADVAVSIREACKTSCVLLQRCCRVYRGSFAKPPVFCCIDVAVSIREAARVLLRRRRRVYRRSCKTSCLLAAETSSCL